MSGIQTPQYKGVRTKFAVIIKALKAAKSKDELKDQLVALGWIGDDGNLSEADLVNCALGRIQAKATEYDTFYNVLCQVTGMKETADEMNSPDLRVNPAQGQGGHFATDAAENKDEGQEWEKTSLKNQQNDGAPGKTRGISDDGPLDFFRRKKPSSDIEELFLPYEINNEKEKKHGLALIIVNKTFKPHPKHPEKVALLKREYADTDRKKLEELWKSLGYRVRVELDKTAEDIEGLFDKILVESDPAKTIQQGDDSFVFCISSHGTWDPALGTDVVYGVEGVQVGKDHLVIKEGAVETKDVKADGVYEVKGDAMEKARQVITKGAVDIKDLAYNKLSSLSCPQLRGRPKLFFIQACRGKRHPKIAADDGAMGKKSVFNLPKCLAQETDFFFAYATARGCKAYRNDGVRGRPLGSFFISYLHKCLKSYAHKLPLVPILEVVSQHQALEEPYDVEDGDQDVTTRQSPNFSSSLRGPVFFSNDARKQYVEGLISGLEKK